jgi:hypothetical protein
MLTSLTHKSCLLQNLNRVNLTLTVKASVLLVGSVRMLTPLTHKSCLLQNINRLNLTLTLKASVLFVGSTSCQRIPPLGAHRFWDRKYYSAFIKPNTLRCNMTS